MNSIAIDTSTIDVDTLNEAFAPRLAKYLQEDEECLSFPATRGFVGYAPVFPQANLAELYLDSPSAETFNSARNRIAFSRIDEKPRLQYLMAATWISVATSTLGVVQTKKVETDQLIQAVRARLRRNCAAGSEYRFLGSVIRLEKLGNIDAALDLLYDQIDAKLKAGKFEETDKFLQSLSAVTLSLDLLLGILTASLPARYKLPSRASFFKKVEDVLKKRNEWEENLLSGLES